MQLIHFSKLFPDATAKELIQYARATGAEGYDLAARPGYIVGPDNIENLPDLVKTLQAEALSVPMITAPADLISPSDPRSRRYAEAMARAGVPLMKLGYYNFDPDGDYWAKVDEICRDVEAWEKLAKRYNIAVCYHTYSGMYMGQNASSVAHFVHDFDSRYIGFYLDPGHLRITGESFDYAAAVAADQLKAVALKDFLTPSRGLTPAGEGHVDWQTVFSVLAKRDYQGPLSVHTEYELPPGEAALPLVAQEISYFRNYRDKAEKSTF
jgi:sugar phosphate isomerase/epimerase